MVCQELVLYSEQDKVLGLTELTVYWGRQRVNKQRVNAKYNMPDDECYEEIKQSKEREGESDQGMLLSKKEGSILTDERERAL